MAAAPRCIFVTGGTGYLGRPLIARLVESGYDVRALVRRGSEAKLPSGCTAIAGNALDASLYAKQIHPADTFVQLVGVSHPNPSKAAEFRNVDLASATGAVRAAAESGVRHFVYLSVAHPAPVRSRTRPPMAIRSAPSLLADGAAPQDPRRSAASRPGYVGPNGTCTGLRGGESLPWSTHRRGP